MFPTLYIPHGGGPCFFMDDPSDMWKGMEQFLRGVLSTLPERPLAILVISSHWEEPQFMFGANPAPPLIYDYSGFPEHTYKLSFPAPGSPELAAQAQALLEQAGIEAGEDEMRGLDHGVFVPFLLITPEADIPVVQMSLKKGLSPAEHIKAGRALAPLREEGVLIVGSGMSYHNMRGFSPQFKPVSEQFDAWLTDSVCNSTGDARAKKLEQWEQAPNARLCHPREEHFISLHVAAGAAYDEHATHIYSGNVLNVAVSGYRFG